MTFEKDVQPIFARKCRSCHSGPVCEGKLNLSSYNLLIKGGSRGRALLPGRPGDSLIVQLAGRTRKPYMPPRGEEPLTPQELALLKGWIEQGAKAPPIAVAERPRVQLRRLPLVVHPARAVALAPDGALVAAAWGNEIHLYDAKAGAHRRSLVNVLLAGTEPQPVRVAHRSVVEALAFSPDGKTLASGAFQEVTLWDLATGLPARRLTGFAHRIAALAYSPNGRYLAVAGGAPAEEGEVKLLDATDGRVVTDLKGAHSDTVLGLAFSPDSARLATGSADRTVKVSELPGGKLLRKFEGHTGYVQDVAWSRDGKVIASAGADPSVKLWDFGRGEQLQTLSGHAAPVARVSFLGDGPLIASAAGDGTVRIWNTETGKPVRMISAGGYLSALAASPDGAFLVTGAENGALKIFDVASGRMVRELKPPRDPFEAATRK